MEVAALGHDTGHVAATYHLANHSLHPNREVDSTLEFPAFNNLHLSYPANTMRASTATDA